MGFLKKKKGKYAAEASVVQDVKPSKRKKKDTLESVLHETVLMKALECLKQNHTFAMDKDGRQVYMTLALNVNDIGGLSKSTAKNNEAKGSIISCINGGHIKTIVMPELTEKDVFLIIPDRDTMLRMEEFSILTVAPYTLAYIDPDEGVRLTDVKVTFQQAMYVSEGQQQISDLYACLTATNEATVDDDSIENDSVELNDDIDGDIDSNMSMADAFSSDADAGDAVVADAVDEPVASSVDDVFNDGFYDNQVGSSYARGADQDEPNYSGLDESDQYDDYDEEAESNYDEDAMLDFDDMGEIAASEDLDYDDDADDQIVSEESVRTALSQILYADTLHLEVSLEQFDARFQFDQPQLFNETLQADGVSPWLQSQYQERAAIANTALKHMHAEHRTLMRDAFLDAMNKQALQLYHKLEFENPQTVFGQRFSDLQEARQTARVNLDQTIHAERAKIEAKFNEKKVAAGEAARVEAEQKFENRFAPMREQALRDIEKQITERGETDYQQEFHQLAQDRKDTAQRLFAHCEVVILDALAQQFQNYLTEERDKFDALQHDLIAFLDANRKQDIARAEALRDSSRNDERIVQIESETQATIARIKADFDSQVAAAHASVEHAKQNAAREREMLINTCEDRMDDLRMQIKRQQTELDDAREHNQKLMKDLASVESNVADRYEHSMSDLKGDVAHERDRYRELQRSQRRGNMITTAVAVIAILAALGVGFIFGLQHNLESLVDGMRSEPASSMTTPDTDPVSSVTE